MNTIEDVLLVSRTYGHPRDLVFRAWTEADRLEKWFVPAKEMTVKVQVDLRVGGRYNFVMRSPAGDEYVGGGEYKEIDRPENLAFTWQWDAGTKDSGVVSLVSIELKEVSEGTELTLRHTGLPNADSFAEHMHGWQGCLDSLGEFLPSSDDSPMQLSGGPTDPVSSSAMIFQAKKVAEMALSRVKDTFAHVPEEKLHWVPAPSAKSAIRIVAHLAFSNQYFAHVLRGEPEGNKDFPEVLAWLTAQEQTISTRSEADALILRTSEDVLSAIDGLDPCALASNPRSSFILTLVGRHADSHAAQIDYLQTIWGDLEDHFGM